jgi:hypothetical protein
MVFPRRSNEHKSRQRTTVIRDHSAAVADSGVKDASGQKSMQKSPDSVCGTNTVNVMGVPAGLSLIITE